jgi:hypothetical protein
MNGGQKAIVCVAVGAVVVVLGFAARALWWETPTDGWFNYAPNNGVIFTSGEPDRGSILTQVAVWIGLVVLWAAVCLLVLRDRTPDNRAASTPPST